VAWILFDADNDKEWSRFGRLDLLAGIDRFPLDPDRMAVLEGGKCWRIGPGVGDKRIGLLLDGSKHLRLLHSFVVSVLALGAVAAVAAVGCATIYGRRVASMLHDVARSARAVRSSTDGRVSLELANAPSEVLEVAAALREMLVNIEREADKARLIVAGLAHELRSPIQNLLGETEVALLRQRSAEEYRAVLASHLDELRDLGRVVDNLVLLCATQDAVGARELEDFDLGHEAELRLSKDRDRATQEGLRLELSRLGDLSFHGDREALLLALRNLVTNALKWSPPAGTVRVQLIGESERLLFLVDDAGPGVPPKIRERVFEPFFQGQPTASAPATASASR
jgi:two-component system heavy metal sensor histidine kinase CusS